MFSVLDLGLQPLANGLVKKDSDQTTPNYPLHMFVCLDCGLGQLGEYATPNEIFEDYRYLSSVSEYWNSHAKSFSESSIDRLGLTSKSFVLEVASNDGYLLKHFQGEGLTVLGVEPAKNVADIAVANGVPTISEFMTEELGLKIRGQYPEPDLIPANNVLAHVPNILDFLAGISNIMGDKTVLTVENPSMLEMLKNCHFDTIYHEHYSYLTTNSVQTAVNQVGLEIFDVERLNTHGGSLRYWICKIGSREVLPSVGHELQRELVAGLKSEDIYRDFANRAGKSIKEFSEFLNSAKDRNESVVGYGAAAKSVVLLNSVSATPNLVSFVVDAGREKQGYLIPTCNIEIRPPSSLEEFNPENIVVFPWNIANEITENISRIAGIHPKIWVALPEMTQINAG